MRERVDADRHPSSRQQAVSTMEVCAIFPRLSLDKINKTMPKLPAATTDVNTQVMVMCNAYVWTKENGLSRCGVAPSARVCAVVVGMGRGCVGNGSVVVDDLRTRW